MATLTKLYLGVIQRDIHTGVVTWHYGDVEVKETPKQYRMTEEADKATWYSGYSGKTFLKTDLDYMGNQFGYKGKFSLEDDEKAVKSAIRSELLEEMKRLEARYNRLVEKGSSSNYLKSIMEETEQALSVLD